MKIDALKDWWNLKSSQLFSSNCNLKAQIIQRSCNLLNLSAGTNSGMRGAYFKGAAHSVEVWSCLRFNLALPSVKVALFCRVNGAGEALFTEGVQFVPTAPFTQSRQRCSTRALYSIFKFGASKIKHY